MDPVRILLLEDSALDADLTAAALRRGGIQASIHRVDARKPFIEALTGGTFDIILADYALPEFDGLAALEIALVNAPETPFILVSGVLGEEFAIDALHRGATDYVLKSKLDRLPYSVNRAISAARDAAERKRSEQALRQTEAFARRILESSRDCVMVLQTSGEIVSMNGFGRTLMSIDGSADVRGRPFAGVWDTQSEQAAKSALADAIKGGAGSFEAVTTLASGERRFWDVMVTPVIDGAQPADQVVAAARDITERKRAEVERQSLLAREREARAEAEARTVELQRSLEDLQHFAYAASHDLREPMRVIALYSELLQRRFASNADPQSLESLFFIEQSARRLDALLTGIQWYAGVVNSSHAYSECDMGAITAEAIRNCAVTIAEVHAEISYEQLPGVEGNHGQLLQVMQNLIENALKYRSAQPPDIRVHAQESNDKKYWLFQVTDNGIGFDPQYAEQIFGIFKRLHGNEYAGTGMGLAICRRIVERHGGKIWAESRPGKGSTFYFSLPKPATRK